MNAFERSSPFVRDIAPIGLDPWVAFKLDENDPNEVPMSDYDRGRILAEQKYPEPLSGSFEELCLMSLIRNHRLQCSRNETQLGELEIADPESLLRAKQGKNTPSQTIALHYEQRGLVSTQFALHSHNDWSDVEYIDKVTMADIFDHADVTDAVPVFQTPTVKLKDAGVESQIIAIKDVKASHFGDTTFSKRRHMVAIDLSRIPSGDDLLISILDVREEHRRTLAEMSDAEREAERFEFYERDQPTIAKYILRYLMMSEKPDWLRPHQTSYYVVHPGRQKAAEAAEAAKKAEEKARAVQTSVKYRTLPDVRLIAGPHISGD